MKMIETMKSWFGNNGSITIIFTLQIKKNCVLIPSAFDGVIGGNTKQKYTGEHTRIKTAIFIRAVCVISTFYKTRSYSYNRMQMCDKF